MTDRPRRGLAALLLVAALALAGVTAAAQEMKFFRIGTGGVAGTYFPIGGLIANAISNPPGSRPCAEGGSCGVPGLVAIAVASNGAVANVDAIQGGSLESGFSQSDIAYWGFSGTGVFEGKPKAGDLRAIANLYPETLHLVARKGAGIRSVADLRGKRVSLEQPGSGTLVDARIVLAAYGLSETDVEAAYLKPDLAGEKMRDGALDAFFFIGGSPANAIVELAASTGIELVPIGGAEAARLIDENPFFAADTVAADTYAGVPETPTIAVNAQWVASARVPDDLVYAVTAALWNGNTRKLLDSGHAKGKVIKAETALSGLGIPLHPGAEKFYREAGLLK